MKQRLLTLCIALCFDAAFAVNALAQDSGGAAFNGGLIGGALGGILGTKNSIGAIVEESRREEPKRTATRTLQYKLKRLDFYTGEIDGLYGPKTFAAIRAFQTSINEKPTGDLTARQTEILEKLYLRLGPGGTGSDPALPGSGRWAQTASVQVGEIYASRLFAGPNDYPPTEFAAYGIVAFKAAASSRDRDRYVMMCEAYMASIRSVRELARARSEQMVTVWPIRSDEVAAELTLSDDKALCGRAVDNYGILMADRAIRQARLADADVDGIGPYLLAWSPPAKKGAPDAIVLIADLSEVTSYSQALRVMSDWVRDIERDPQLWSRGWTLDALRVKVQQWVDRRGTQILTAVGSVQ